MKRKSLAVVSMAVMMAGVLTACGGSDGTGQAGTGTQQENVSVALSQDKTDSQADDTKQGSVLNRR